MNNNGYERGGYFYAKKNTTPLATYYQCRRKGSAYCPARATLNNNNEFIITVPHDHFPDAKFLTSENFKRELWIETVSSSSENLNHLYQRIAANNLGGSALIPFTSIARSMARWRATIRPAIPHSLEEYSNLLMSDAWQHLTEYGSGKIQAITLRVTNDSFVTILGDLEFSRQLYSAEISIDGTFAVCPRGMGIVQLVTIMAMIDDAPLPIAWALTQHKKTNVYETIFRYFSNHMAPNIRPERIHLDYEKALKNGILTIFPRAVVIPCFFHYLQALSRKLESKGKKFMEKLNSWRHGKIFFRKLGALALLPPADIPRAFDWLVANATQDILESFQPLIRYYRSWWLNKVKPENFSVYGHIHRTNNFIEAYHRVLGQKMQRHPSIIKFTEDLVSLQSATWSKWMSLNMGQTVRRSRESRYVIQDQIVKEARELYDNEVLDIPRFLSVANHLLRNFNNRLLIRSSEQLAYFVTAQNHNILEEPNIVRVNDIVIEEATEGIQILDNPMVGGNLEVLLLRDIHTSRCNICNTSILDHICLPCKHWFGCQKCTEMLIEWGVADNSPIVCRICSELSTAIQRVYVT